MKYHLAFDEAGNVTSKLRRNRLVKRENHFRWHGAVHEYLLVGGNILNADIAVKYVSDTKQGRSENVIVSDLQVHSKM